MSDWWLERNSGGADSANCRTCPFRTTEWQQASRIVKITSTKGVGRTGNYVMMLEKALHFAYVCGAMLVLPTKDERGHVLQLGNGHHLLDFSGHGVEPSNPLCRNVTDNARAFWARKMPTAKFTTTQKLQKRSCFQHYLGVCREDLCNDFYGDSSLVVHVRQGDIFKANFSSSVNRNYWQPPFSYIISAMQFSNAKEVRFVGDCRGENLSPVWLQGKLLSMFELPRVPFYFQCSRNFFDDLRILLCAKTRVESNSSLNSLLKYGFAHTIYSYKCSHGGTLDIVRYVIKFKQAMGKHDNSPREWIEMLLKNSSTPQKCEPSLKSSFPADIVHTNIEKNI